MALNKDDFLNSYHEQLNSFCLPAHLTDSYQIIDCLKESQHKTIYLLSDSEDNLYILKRGLGRYAPLLQQEYDILSHLENTNEALFPKCLDLWSEENVTYLLRTYIKGKSLANYLENTMFLSQKKIVSLSIQICHIVECLHQQQPPIIHRDIKPENFVIDEASYSLYLIDFDTARQFHPDKSRDTQLMGTPSHAAPEQFGFFQSDFRTDIYGIGKTILYLATRSSDEKNCTTDSLPKNLYRIVQRCIAFSPEKRYSNVKTLQRDLKRCLHRLSFRSSPTFHVCIIIAFLVCTYSSSYGICIYNNHIEHTTPATNDTYPTTISSLRNQAEPSKYNLYQYQEHLDTILLSYFANDFETMTTETEQLMEALYADKALSEIETEDYAVVGYLPDHFWQLESPYIIRTLLVYRDGIMQKNLGNYEEVRPFIVSSLNAYFYNPGLFEGTPNIVSYANCPEEEQASYYEQALIDYVAAMNSAFDDLYGYETPTEKGYSDE